MDAELTGDYQGLDSRLGNCSMHCSTSCMAQASLSTGSLSHLLHAVVRGNDEKKCMVVVLACAEDDDGLALDR
jgi:hypothetical protein